MTSWHGNACCITGSLWGLSTNGFPSQRANTVELGFFYRVSLNTLLNISRVTGPLWGELTGDRWIPFTKSQWRGALMFSLICTGPYDSENNGDAADLRRHRAHFDATAMHIKMFFCCYQDYHTAIVTIVFCIFEVPYTKRCIDGNTNSPLKLNNMSLQTDWWNEPSS